MMPSNRYFTLALGVVLTFAMCQTSDAQLFRSRRCPCPAPAVKYCYPQQGITKAAPAVRYPASQNIVRSATSSNVATPAITAPLNSTNIMPLPLVINSPTDLPISSPVETQAVFESTPSVSTTVDTTASAEPEVVIYESASDIPVADSTTNVVVPAAGAEDIMLTAPTPAPAPVQAPTPVATGDTVIKSETSQPIETPEAPQSADSLESKAVEKVKNVERSILTD